MIRNWTNTNTQLSLKLFRRLLMKIKKAVFLIITGICCSSCSFGPPIYTATVYYDKTLGFRYFLETVDNTHLFLSQNDIFYKMFIDGVDVGKNIFFENTTSLTLDIVLHDGLFPINKERLFETYIGRDDTYLTYKPCNPDLHYKTSLYDETVQYALALRISDLNEEEENQLLEVEYESIYLNVFMIGDTYNTFYKAPFHNIVLWNTFLSTRENDGEVIYKKGLKNWKVTETRIFKPNIGPENEYTDNDYYTKSNVEIMRGIYHFRTDTEILFPFD